MFKLLQKVGIIAGIILIANCLLTIAFSSLTLSNCLSAIVGSIILLYSFFCKELSAFCNKGILFFLHKLFKIGLCFFIISFFVCSAIISHKMNVEPPKNCDAIVVLGAALVGENVSLTLAHRLDTAYEYYLEHENAIIIVSGGQGDNEVIPEAVAMKRYLISSGVPEEKIIEEDKSSRTVENFLFSKTILDEYFEDDEYTISFVTNGFHVFRSSMIANKIGIEATGIPSESVDFLAITQYVCEYFSILKFFILDFFVL